MTPPRIQYLNTPGDMLNQVTIQKQIQAFVGKNSLKDYYYQIRYSDNDALIDYFCWDEADQKLVKQGCVNAASQPLPAPATQTTHIQRGSSQ